MSSPANIFTRVASRHSSRNMHTADQPRATMRALIAARSAYKAALRPQHTTHKATTAALPPSSPKGRTATRPLLSSRAAANHAKAEAFRRATLLRLGMHRLDDEVADRKLQDMRALLFAQANRLEERKAAAAAEAQRVKEEEEDDWPETPFWQPWRHGSDVSPRPETKFVKACRAAAQWDPSPYRKLTPLSKPSRPAKMVQWADEVLGESLTSVREFRRHPLEPFGMVGFPDNLFKPISWRNDERPMRRCLDGPSGKPFKVLDGPNGQPYTRFRTEQAEHRYRAVRSYYERQKNSWLNCVNPNMTIVRQTVPLFYGKRVDGIWTGARMFLDSEEAYPFGYCIGGAEVGWHFEASVPWEWDSCPGFPAWYSCSIGRYGQAFDEEFRFVAP